MRGVVPPGVTVPLHSHDDAEDFFILSGTQQVLSESDSGCNGVTLMRGICPHPSWDPARAPQRVRPAGGRASHHRRAARAILSRDRPARLLTQPPTPDELADFITVATKYGYILGTLEQTPLSGIALSF